MRAARILATLKSAGEGAPARRPRGLLTGTALATLPLALTLALLPEAPVAAQQIPQGGAGTQGTEAASQPATLVADSVYVDAEGRLTASGAVEVFHGTTRMSASRIVYDPDGKRLSIEGPITLIENGGQQIVLASQAELSTDMTSGILTGARLVLDRQLQIATAELSRVDNRYNQATRVRASACEVCASNPVPLWEIRATRVVHDEQERQLYFDNAQLRVVSLPVFWLPMLRIPDPTLTRARGFLFPSIRSTSGLGTGLKLPYFVPLGDSADVTVTPYVSTNQTRTLDLAYRQAFANGEIEFNGAISRDDLEPGETRGYLFGVGQFRLRNDFVLTFGIETVSDDAYLTDYGIGDEDRLASGIELTRTRRNEYILGRVMNYQTLRDGETNATQPNLVTDMTWHRRFAPALIGGEGGLSFETHTHRRTSDADTDVNGDGVVDGRDVASLTIQGDWRRNWVMDNGMILAGLGQLTADFYDVRQDAEFENSISRLTSTVGVELRWPFVRSARTPDGASWVIEPVSQLVWSPENQTRVPNEDSVLVEFDEGNLFSLDRFPGNDAHEEGLRANLGMSFTRYDAEGSTLNLTLGRVLRQRDLNQFNASTGLDDVRSDWMIFSQYAADWGLTLSNRAVVSDGLDFARDEFRLVWKDDKYAIGSSYIWLEEDEAEERDLPTSEWTLDADLDLSDRWSASFESRYDFEAEQASRAGVGVEYRSECVAVNLSLSRRYTSSDNVRPSTDLDLSVVLSGFGSGNRVTPAMRRCSG